MIEVLLFETDLWYSWKHMRCLHAFFVLTFIWYCILWTWLTFNGLWIVQVSYMILQRVSPVTHSVGNCVKRVVVIVSSVIFFQTPVSLINSLGKFLDLDFQRIFLITECQMLEVHFLPVANVFLKFWSGAGTGLALAGVFLYSRVKRIKPKAKTAWTSFNQVLLSTRDIRWGKPRLMHWTKCL